jgi:hypothetical protein
MRNVLFAIATLVTLAPATAGPDEAPWAEKLFDSKTEHNFGNVAHGTEMIHKFEFKNIYKVPLDVTISNVSCHCTSATSSTARVEPLGTGTIDIAMNGRLFTGSRTVYIYVRFSNPQFYSTATLKVAANSRQDIVFNPGSVDFGVVAQGQGPAKDVVVAYAGALKWEVSGVVTNGLPVEAKVEPVRTSKPGEVGYKVSVSLKPDAPAGSLKGEMFLKTNDPASPLLPLTVEGNVQAALSASPSSVRLSAQVNEAGRGSVAVRGQKAFRILSVEGLGEGLTLENQLPDAPSETHKLTFVVKRAEAGDFRRKVRIATDLQKAPVVVTVEGSVSP